MGEQELKIGGFSGRCQVDKGKSSNDQVIGEFMKVIGRSEHFQGDDIDYNGCQRNCD